MEVKAIVLYCCTKGQKKVPVYCTVVPFRAVLYMYSTAATCDCLLHLHYGTVLRLHYGTVVWWNSVLSAAE